MEYYHLEPTEETPKVIFNKREGLLSMEGRCIPENALQFFSPITEMLEKNLTIDDAKLKVQLMLDYFSTSSSKHLLAILRLLEKKKHDLNLDVHVEWMYKAGDDDLRESGEDYATLTAIPFVFTII